MRSPRIRPAASPPRIRSLLGRMISVGLASLALTSVAFSAPYGGRTGAQKDPPARAGEGIFLGPIIFSPSVNLSLSYDSNIFDVNQDATIQTASSVVELSPTGDSQTTARVRLAFKVPFHRSYASIAWTPQYKQYGRSRSPLNVSHQLSFESRLNFANGSTVVVKDEYVSSHIDIRRVDAQGRLGFDGTPYNQNHPSLDFDWSIAGDWGVAGTLERTDFSFDRTLAADVATQTDTSGTAERALFDFFDYITDSVEARGYRNFPRYQIFAAATVARTDQDRRKYNASRCNVSSPPAYCSKLIPAEQIDAAELSAGIKGNLVLNTVAEIQIGYTSWNFKRSGNPSFSGAKISGKIDHMFDRMTLGFMHFSVTPYQATGQYTGYYLAQRLGVGLERKLTMRLSARAGVDIDRTSIPKESDAGDPAFSYVDYNGDFALRYQPGAINGQGPIAFVLAYSPLIRTSTRQDLDSRSQRVGFSIQYGWF